ncbi:MAG: hypothetical protein WBA97_34325 [Actinophytocola sp.]
MDLLDALFAAHVEDIDSEPFAHEDAWTYPVGDPRTEATHG